MRVAIVHDFLMKLGGAERVVKALADMFPEAPIYCLIYDEAVVGDVFPRERVRPSCLQKYPKFLRNRYKYFVHKIPEAVESMNFEEFDLVISSNTAFSHGIIVARDTKHVCYCHSPMRYAWDWTNEYQKENDIRGLKKIFYTWLMKGLREWDQVASDRPDMYLANSKTVQKRIKKYYRTGSDVVYPPVDTDRFCVEEENEGYFLIVSTLTPYKRVDLAVQLFNKIGRKLVVIGDGTHRKYLERIACDNIDFLGFKDDKIVSEYLKNCRAFIFPGEDDFGITPIEAMACGKPVLAYGKGGATETIESAKTGEFFFEPTVESMEDGLARLMYNEKFYKAHSIRQHALQFSQDIFKEKITTLISKITSC